MTSKEYFKVASAYFGLVFTAGFVLGPIRILWLVPRVGVRTAELVEIPLMVAVTIFAARWIVGHFKLPNLLGVRLLIGVLALCFMLAAELGLALALTRVTLSEYIAGRDPISGAAYLLALGVFAFMPALLIYCQQFRARLHIPDHG